MPDGARVLCKYHPRAQQNLADSSCNNVLSTAHEEHLQLKSGLSRERSLPSERVCSPCFA